MSEFLAGRIVNCGSVGKCFEPIDRCRGENGLKQGASLLPRSLPHTRGPICMSRLALAKKGLIEIWVWHGPAPRSLARSLSGPPASPPLSVRGRPAGRMGSFQSLARSVGAPSARFIWERKSLPISVISVASAAAAVPAEEGRMHLLGRLLHQVALR